MNYSFRAIIFAFITLFCYSCKKSELAPVTDDALPIQQVQKAFTVIQPTKPQGGSQAPNTDFHKPDWKQATWVPRQGEWSYWRIPLASDKKIKRLLIDEDTEKKTRHTVALPDPWLMAYEDSSKNMQFYVIQEEPVMPGNTRQSPSKKFTGNLSIYTWTGKYQYGIGYENGIRKTRITRKKRGISDASARWDYQCNLTRICIYQSQCVYKKDGEDFYTVSLLRARQVSSDPFSCEYDGNPTGSLYTEQNGMLLGNIIISTCYFDWEYVDSETTGTCEWIWIPVSSNPNPDPGGIGDVTDPDWTPQMDVTPCQTKNYIAQLVTKPGVYTAISNARAKLANTTQEWGTPIWYTTLDDATTLTSGNVTSGSLSTWSYLFEWNSVNKFMISEVHTHPNNSVPSPADIFGLLENVGRVRALSNQNNFHVRYYMQNAAIFVVSSSSDWVITGGKWGELYTLYEEYVADPAAFDNKVSAKANLYGNSTRAIKEIFGNSINILMSPPGSNIFVPVQYDPIQNIMVEAPCN